LAHRILISLRHRRGRVLFLVMLPRPPGSPLFPYTTLFRSLPLQYQAGESASSLCLTGGEVYTVTGIADGLRPSGTVTVRARGEGDRKSTRLNSSHVAISYAVFCLKKKKDVAVAG